MMMNKYDAAILTALVLALGPVSAENSTDDTSATETEALNNYAAAEAAGRHAEATKYVLDYMEKTEGENAPLTVALTHRYGTLLREEGNVRDAIAALKTARERGIIAFGEQGIELFAINLDLGEAYVERDIGLRKPKKYFDDALKVLRENGQRETVLYVRTLVGITSRLAQAGALGGALSADTSGVNLRNPGGGNSETLINSGLSSLNHAYKSGYGVLEEYMREAVELAEALEIEDPYLSAKVEIVQAKTKILENLFTEAVTPNIRGSISGATARENYQREDDKLLSAIDVLMADSEKNRGFLDIANGARLDVAWLSKDIEKMANFCNANTLNMASRYPPDRLYEIEDDGSVIAPRFSFNITSNIFKRQKARKVYNRDADREVNETPHFVPVCINGHLMAALINAPKVSIEEID